MYEGGDTGGETGGEAGGETGGEAVEEALSPGGSSAPLPGPAWPLGGPGGDPDPSGGSILVSDMQGTPAPI